MLVFFGKKFVSVEADLVQVTAAVIQAVDLSVFGQAILGILLFRWHFPLVLGYELAIFVVVGAVKGGVQARSSEN